jgi:hypothetical protein
MEVRDWAVEDPMGEAEDQYVIARDQIEHLVMRLILDLRKASRPVAHAPRARATRP